jgi:hypothetical protein
MASSTELWHSHAVDVYGPELRIVGGLGIERRGERYGRGLPTTAMDGVVAGRWLYVTGRGNQAALSV